jgi:hypothetical protein
MMPRMCMCCHNIFLFEFILNSFLFRRSIHSFRQLINTMYPELTPSSWGGNAKSWGSPSTKDTQWSSTGNTSSSSWGSIYANTWKSFSTRETRSSTFTSSWRGGSISLSTWDSSINLSYTIPRNVKTSSFLGQ